MLTFVLPRSIVLSIGACYALPYLIPSEQYGGRGSFPFAGVSQLAHYVLRRAIGDNLKSMEMKNKEGAKAGNIICAHPHGMLPLGFCANLLTSYIDDWEFLSNQRFAVASFAFWIPGLREFYHALGCIDAGKASLKRTLDKGNQVIVCPGGACEALYTDPDEDVALLSGRTGFIRLAFEHGASVVPAYTFGEADIWLIEKADAGTLKERFFLTSQMIFGLGMILVKHFKPRPVALKTVFGPAIKFPKVANPSAEEVNRMLDTYKAALVKLYNEHTPHKDRSLRFVENQMRRYEPSWFGPRSATRSKTD
jgi:1-acyl-sn-glycerol-3-phosphate acyltransferase